MAAVRFHCPQIHTGAYGVVVSPKPAPTPRQAGEAIDRLLSAVQTEADIFVALSDIYPLHPKDNTFPGEVFVSLGAGALDQGGVERHHPISEERLVERYLPECQFRGRDNRKIRYAILAVAATHGGIDVDLLEEVAYWGTDDFWSYAGLAAVAWIRAVADQRGIALPELCARLRTQTGGRTGGR